jgi:hypothetical protein
VYVDTWQAQMLVLCNPHSAVIKQILCYWFPLVRHQRRANCRHHGTSSHAGHVLACSVCLWHYKECLTILQSHSGH